MTYCVGLCLRDGLLFASDSRTNAGVDYVTTYSKMHVFTPAPDRMFVLLSAGSLATTQEIINHINRDLEYSEDGNNLLSSRYLFEAAEYIASLSQRVQQNHSQALQQAGVSGEVTLILGGQIQGQPHGMLMIYPQGNYIEASESTPYLQIGETKYGKPVLDRLLHYDLPMNDAARLALVSLTSTANSNITVGPPFELSVYSPDQFQLASHCRFEQNGSFVNELEAAWKQGMQQAFNSLPRFEWESGQPGKSSHDSSECAVPARPTAQRQQQQQQQTNTSQPIPMIDQITT
jgi:putative proteasome-type protease